MYRLIEVAKLRDGVLPRSCIQDLDDLVRCAFSDLSQHALDLPELFHQVFVRMLATRGVYQKDVGASGYR